MIEIFDNGVRKVVLGEGTTYISQIVAKGDTMSSGIVFTNTPPMKDFNLNGDEVIIEITNIQGFLSYMRAGVDLLKTWQLEGLEEQIDSLIQTFEVLTKK